MPFRWISFCGTVPRLGTSPRLLENESVSAVRLSSRTLSLLGNGIGSGGELGLLGRKMVLKPLPAKSPANAESGPSGGGTGVGAGLVWSGRSSPKKKSLGRLMVALGFESLIVVSIFGKVSLSLGLRQID